LGIPPASANDRGKFGNPRAPLRRSGSAWDRCGIGVADGKIIPTELGHLRKPMISKNKMQLT
jgi:hypothetical protein